MNASVERSVEFILRQTTQRPRVGIILGSGLGDFADHITVETILETRNIPHYPVSTVEGHHGRLVFGKIGKTPLLAFQGRIHFYESGRLPIVLYPILVAKHLGINTLFVTNAAGGVNPSFVPGDLMLISDQVNLTFKDPLREISMPKIRAELYDGDLKRLVVEVARRQGCPLREGVYASVVGPSYETASEVQMVRRIGCDAVGMSTIHEVTVANALGMKVAGISCITNLATGIGNTPLSHAEVTEVASRVRERFTRLLTGIVRKL